MELIRSSDIQVFSNSGIESRQLLFPENSSSKRVTITQVMVPPGGKNPPHRHSASEQIWIALQGSGNLLLESGETVGFAEGDVVRFEEGDLHGFFNSGTQTFVYMSVTSPPLNFRAAYDSDWSR
ncbi:MAG: cupin domain-containing protein [Gemmatimonadota bacterium]|nr:cupin domain-containing protein [Gemmatimonadota bacterium]